MPLSVWDEGFTYLLQPPEGYNQSTQLIEWGRDVCLPLGAIEKDESTIGSVEIQTNNC
jgi:hypothetical protein